MWQVTDIDVPATPTGSAGNDEATVDIKDAITGQRVTVDLDEDGTVANEYAGSEVIDGQTYYFRIPDGTASPVVVQATWGSGRTAGDAGDDTTLYPALDLDSGAALAFTNDVILGDTADSSGNLTYTLPSTESTDAQTLSVVYRANGDMAFQVNGADVVAVDESGLADTGTDAAVTDPGNEAVINVGEVSYAVNYDVSDSDEDGTVNADSVTINSIGLNSDGLGAYAAGSNAATGGSGALGTPASLVIEPEDENDNEHAYVHVPGDGGDELDAGGAAAAVSYTGSGYSQITLESNDDKSVEYDVFGTHTVQDSDGQGSFTLHLPNGQAVAGAAFTGNGGDLTAGGSAGSVSYTAVTGMGALPNMARLDSEVTESVRSNNHLILVGGPAVNTLVSDLVDSGDVDMTELADQGSGAMLQVVEDAFTSEKHALVVAGYGAADTRAASRYLANYDAHSDALADAGKSMVLTEADYPSEN